MTHYARVITLLEAGRPQRRAEIMASCSMTERVADRVLAELIQRKQIRRVALGVYALPNHPNLPKKK